MFCVYVRSLCVCVVHVQHNSTHTHAHTRTHTHTHTHSQTHHTDLEPTHVSCGATWTREEVNAFKTMSGTDSACVCVCAGVCVLGC